LIFYALNLDLHLSPYKDFKAPYMVRHYLETVFNYYLFLKLYWLPDDFFTQRGRGSAFCCNNSFV